MLDIYPAASGHVLVLPKKHYQDLYDVPQELVAHIGAVCKKVAVNLKKSLGVKSVNLIHGSGKQAQQDIFHFHMHVVPREEGDGFKLHYEPLKKEKTDFDKIMKSIKEFPV